MEYLTPEEVATQLRVTAKTIRRWCQLGQLRADRVGRQWRISPTAVAEFVNTQERVKPDYEAAGLVDCSTRPATAVMMQLPY